MILLENPRATPIGGERPLRPGRVLSLREESLMSIAVVQNNELPWRQIAESAYQAFATCKGEEPILSFGQISQSEQHAWEAAVQHASRVAACHACFDLTEAERQKFTDPSQWAGWIPRTLAERM